MAGSHDVRSIIAGITSDSESSRKLSAYHLQSLVSDASFARTFVQAQGVPALKQVILEENGNALAYALGSLTRLLEMELGWDRLSSDVIERVRFNIRKSPKKNKFSDFFWFVPNRLSKLSSLALLSMSFATRCISWFSWSHDLSTPTSCNNLPKTSLVSRLWFRFCKSTPTSSTVWWTNWHLLTMHYVRTPCIW